MERAHADVLIVGAGIAGLAAALGTSKRRRVTLLCPRPPPASTASALAQGGIAAAVGPGDHPMWHAADTIRAGAGASWLPAVVLLCGEAPAAMAWLEAHGVRFDRDGDDRAVHREAAHDRARVLHVGGDATGAGLTSALYRAALSAPNVEILTGLTQVAMIGLLNSMPRTPLYERLRAAGRLREEDSGGHNTKLDTNVVPLGMSRDELIRGYRRLYARLLDDGAIARRIINKNRSLGGAPGAMEYGAGASLRILARLLSRGILSAGPARPWHFLRSLPWPHWRATPGR